MQMSNHLLDFSIHCFFNYIRLLSSLCFWSSVFI